ncbi:unnamed protein product [Spirodela intermedia]|uniref:Uncharacterized protein n=1 Tax=Spirodela intermedia TaxID=51605 RepID=A0A7I8KVI0_SPIIN|nr:unnamed protein product [Spirodela intermedia]
MAGGKDGVVQRVIREVSAGTGFPMLTKTNYSDWALLMKVKLRARLLWTAIEKGGVEPHEDMQALDTLYSAVPPEMWLAIATMRIGDDRVKKASAQNLRRQFDSATFKEGESVEDYALRLNSMASTLNTLGDKVEETQVVEKIIRSVPQRFRQIVVAITMLLDVSTLTVADLTGRLKAAEDAFEELPSAMHHDGKLHLTEEEWDARRRKRDNEKTGGGGSSSVTHRVRHGRRRGRGRGSDKGSSSGGLTSNSGRPRGDECRRCEKLGHWARECRSKPKKEQAHVVQNEEEASLLLVKSTTARSTVPPPTSTPPRFAATPQAEDWLRRASPPPPGAKGVPVNGGATKEERKPGAQTQIHLREEKVFAHLEEEELRDEEAWAVDRGATNHMSGSRTAFTELDTKLVHGLPAAGPVDQLCEACLAGKQKRDLCGPIAPEMPNGSKYFLLLVDDRSRYMWVAMLPSKDRAAVAIKEIKARAKGKSGLKLGALRTDWGGEFTSHEFAEYCAGEGIHREHTVPYSPQQNGIVERRNGTVVATARSMLKAKGLPGWFWGEAVATAVYILNRCPTKSVDGMTPFEVWHGKKPAVHHLKVFGCITYVLNTIPHLKKLEDRGRKMIFISYEYGSKAYQTYDPTTRRVHVTRDVVFDENAQWDWGSGAEQGDAGSHDDMFTLEYAVGNQVPPELDGAIEVLNDDAPGPEPMSPLSVHYSGGAAPIEDGGKDVEFASPPSVHIDHLDANHDDAPLRFRKIDNIVGLASPHGLASRALIAKELHVVSFDEPVSFVEAEGHPSWRKAMEEEMASIEENRTWSLVDLPWSPGDRVEVGVQGEVG